MTFSIQNHCSGACVTRTIWHAMTLLHIDQLHVLNLLLQQIDIRSDEDIPLLVNSKRDCNNHDDDSSDFPADYTFGLKCSVFSQINAMSISVGTTVTHQIFGA